MASISFPTSKDIYLEVNGQRVAAAQSLQCRTTRESRYIEAFGSVEPVGTVAGRVKHILEVKRLAIMGGELNFHELENFNVVVAKPDRKIIFSGCQWADINEAATIDDPILESVKIVAGRRLEIR